MTQIALMTICCCLMCFPHVVLARTTYVECIELVTADADAVLRGTIVRIGPLREDRYHGFRVTVHVVETLKGPKADEVSVAVQTAEPKFDAWLKDKTELLFILRFMGGEKPSCPFLLRGRQSVVELNDKGPGVVTMDFKRLTARADILKAAREGSAAAPDGGIQKRLRFTPPSGSGPGPHLNGDFQTIMVVMPVDKRLQERGERWARSD